MGKSNKKEVRDVLLTALVLSLFGLVAVLLGCISIIFGRSIATTVAGLISCLFGIVAILVAYLISLGAL